MEVLDGSICLRWLDLTEETCVISSLHFIFLLSFLAYILYGKGTEAHTRCLWKRDSCSEMHFAQEIKSSRAKKDEEDRLDSLLRCVQNTTDLPLMMTFIVDRSTNFLDQSIICVLTHADQCLLKPNRVL